MGAVDGLERAKTECSSELRSEAITSTSLHLNNLADHRPDLLAQEAVSRIILTSRVPDHRDRVISILKIRNLKNPQPQSLAGDIHHAARHDAEQIGLADHQQNFEQFGNFELYVEVQTAQRTKGKRTSGFAECDSIDTEGSAATG